MERTGRQNLMYGMRKVKFRHGMLNIVGHLSYRIRMRGDTFENCAIIVIYALAMQVYTSFIDGTALDTFFPDKVNFA
jgi:hypothetical protein